MRLLRTMISRGRYRRVEAIGENAAGSVFFLIKQGCPVFLRKMLLKLPDHFLAHFVAILTDRWSYGCQNISRVASVNFPHLPDRLFPDLRNRSPPSGMTQPDHLFHRIHEKKRHTVCIKCHKTDPPEHPSRDRPHPATQAVV